MAILRQRQIFIRDRTWFIVTIVMGHLMHPGSMDVSTFKCVAVRGVSFWFVYTVVNVGRL